LAGAIVGEAIGGLVSAILGVFGWMNLRLFNNSFLLVMNVVQDTKDSGAINGHIPSRHIEAGKD